MIKGSFDRSQRVSLRATVSRSCITRRSCLHTLGVTGAALSCGALLDKGSDRWFGGDLHLGHSLPGPSPFLRSLPGRGCANLEGPLAKGLGWQSSSKDAAVLLRNHPRSGDWIVSAGIAALCLENNHALDFGRKTRERTASRLLEKKLRVLRHAHRSRPKKKEVWHEVAAFVGPRSERGTGAQDLDAVSRARREGHRVVLSLHVDEPPSYLPSPKTRKCVESFLEAGASVVVLHGSHVIGPVERREGAIVAWGLGNLSFACPCSQQEEGMILSVQGGRGGGLRARICGIVPGNRRRCVRPLAQPQPFFNLLRALGSSSLKVSGAWAEF